MEVELKATQTSFHLITDIKNYSFMKIVGSLFYMVTNKRISEAVLNQLDMFKIKTLHADININVNNLSESQFKEMENMVLFNFVTIKLFYLELLAK